MLRLKRQLRRRVRLRVAQGVGRPPSEDSGEGKAAARGAEEGEEEESPRRQEQRIWRETMRLRQTLAAPLAAVAAEDIAQGRRRHARGVLLFMDQLRPVEEAEMVDTGEEGKGPSGYRSAGMEPFTRSVLMPQCWREGLRVFVPRVMEGDGVLAICEMRVDDFSARDWDATGECIVGMGPLEVSAPPYCIPEPPQELIGQRQEEENADDEEGDTAVLSAVDCVLVPGVAFDRDGGRLGHGKGYYDRLLGRIMAARIARGVQEELRLIGLAFDEQVVEEVPMEEHDVRMHAIATPSEFIQVR